MRRGTTEGRLVPLALAALLAACSDPTGSEPGPSGVAFAVLATTLAPGDTVRAELRNSGTEAVGFNLCFTDLERSSGSRWRLAEELFGVPADGACLGAMFALAPGTAATPQHVIRPDLPAGRYRLRTTVASLGGPGDRTVRTQAFEVRR